VNANGSNVLPSWQLTLKSRELHQNQMTSVQALDLFNILLVKLET